MKKQLFLTTFIMALLVMGLSSCEQLMEIIKPSEHGNDKEPGYVFTMSNASSGNEIIAYMVNEKGELQMASSYPTGGKGSGAGLGSQGSLVWQKETKLLFAVNAGSHEISVLKLTHKGLELLDIVSSGGKMPISLTVYKNILYVVNGGEKNSIYGFRVNTTGKLLPLANSMRYLSTDQSGPAQIQFRPDGKVLVVTEKMTNKITTFVVDGNGVAGNAMVQASVGETPFGFYFRNQQLIVSEAFGGAENKSAVSSYNVAPDGMISVITPSAATNQTAACWIAIPKNGKYAYSANTGSGSISGYSITPNGNLTLLDADGRTGITGEGTRPADMALSNNSQYLFTLNGGTKSISSFHINSDGSLEWIQEIKGLPSSVFGLAAM
jgi:6-phosphogluconolactonase